MKVKANQEESIHKMLDANSNSVVILLNGSPIDMSNWIDNTGTVIEVRYPFGYGLSYTKFAFSDFIHEIEENSVKVTFCLDSSTDIVESFEVRVSDGKLDG